MGELLHAGGARAHRLVGGDLRGDGPLAFADLPIKQGQQPAALPAQQFAGGVRGASARFAALLYELLGGPQRSDGARPPLAALDEAANRTLQRALAGGAFASCAEFWREFLRESGSPQRAIRVQPWLPGSGTLDGHPLAHDRATPLSKRGVLKLAGHYALEVMPHLAPMEDFEIENLRGDALRLDGRTLGVGEAAPLTTGQSLRLAAREYSIEIG